MNCPDCNVCAIVKDARHTPEGYWRKRFCRQCLKIFTTIEQPVVTIPGTRLKKAIVVKVPKPEPVKRPVREKKLKQPKASKPTVSARSLIEDLKMQQVLKELDK